MFLWHSVLLYPDEDKTQSFQLLGRAKYDDSWPLLQHHQGEGGGGGDPHIKSAGMLFGIKPQKKTDLGVA